jgi:hypothetical protein
VDRLMPGLHTVAAAMNANDPCLARIAAVHLRIPDLPDRVHVIASKAKTRSSSQRIGIRRCTRAQALRLILAGSRQPMEQAASHPP